jgi:hypothetical protein
MWGCVVAAALGCGGAPETKEGEHVTLQRPAAEVRPSEPTPTVAPFTPLSAPRLLRRMSLDLRGVLPSVEELDAVEADPAALEPILDSYLEDPRLADRLVDLLAEQWWTRVDVFDIVFEDYFLDPTQEFAFERAIGEEPLRLVAHVMAENKPYTDIVTSDTTMANELLGALWPLDYPEGAVGWRRVPYTDGRPAAGVLSTNGLMWRYTATRSNMNRGRAAALSRLLLCEDYVVRPVSFSAASSDVSDPERAIRTDPYCVTCHASLDPIAATFFGFWWLTLYSRIEQQTYHPEREALAEEIMGVSPGWYGEPVADLGELGVAVANDPRFYSCAVETWARAFWRRPLVAEDQPEAEALRLALVEADARPIPLLRAILMSAEYQAGAVVAEAPEVEARALTARPLSPEVLETSLAERTGFRWQYEGFEQLRNDDHGYRIFAGGVNGISVVEPAVLPSVTSALVSVRIGEGAGSAAVRQALADPDAPTLLRGLDLELVPEDPAFEALIDAAAWQLHGVRLPTEQRDELVTLWAAIVPAVGPAAAWEAVVSALVQDPLFLTD